LRTACVGPHFDKQRAQPIATRTFPAIGFPVEQRLGVVAEIDITASRDFLHAAADQFADAVAVLLDDLRALGLAHLLHDDLLGGLRRDAEFDGQDGISKSRRPARPRLLMRLLRCEHRVGVELFDRTGIDHRPAAERLVLAGLAVDRHAKLGVFLVTLLGGTR
jgi:hypothetical protein